MDHAYQAYSKSIEQCTLTNDMDITTLQQELSRFWDGIYVSVTQAVTDTDTRNLYRMLIQQAKLQSDALLWLDAPAVFYSTSAADNGKRKKPWIGVVGLGLMAALALWFYFSKLDHRMVYVLLLAGSAALTAFQMSKLFLAVPTAPTIQTTAQQRFSPVRIRSALGRMAREIDGNATSLELLLHEVPTVSTSDVDISLVQELMRLPADMRSSQITDAVNRYLIRCGVERVDYSPARQNLFMILPGTEDMTVEPALIKDGQVLAMGVACTK